MDDKTLLDSRKKTLCAPSSPDAAVVSLYLEYKGVFYGSIVEITNDLLTNNREAVSNYCEALVQGMHRVLINIIDGRQEG